MKLTYTHFHFLSFLVCNAVNKINFVSSRRGVINVVSSAILLTSVTMIGTGTVLWTQNTVNAREHDTGLHYTSAINKIKESLGLEKFWYNTPNKKLNLVLKNTGDIGLNVNEIAIQGSHNQISPIANVGIIPNGFYVASITYDWLGDPIDAFVKTTRGSIFRIHLISSTDGVLIINKVSMLGNGNFSYNGDLGKFNVTTTGYVPGANLDGNGNLILSGVIRDFNGTNQPGVHPDFEKQADCNYPSNPPPPYPPPHNVCYGVWTGIILPDLGADREPVYNNNTVSSWNSGFVRFNQWFHDAPGVNMKKNLNITLIKQPTVPVTWKYNNGSFFPIDNQLFGNYQGPGISYSGPKHNFHFTFETHNSFTYRGGETFSFSGDDDVWVFINNKLVIDLGGVHSNQTSNVNLDSLGLTKGNTYNFDFFYAERHTVASEMKITTSIKLEQNGVGRTSAFFVDPGKYTINELIPSGWTLVDRQCDNSFTLPNSTEISIIVPKGTTTCTFTNSK